MEKALKASGCGSLAWNLPGMTGENNKIPHLEYSES
jgi:hypothetical protein